MARSRAQRSTPREITRDLPPLREVTLDVPHCEVRATIDPESIDVEARTFSVVWSTGARVLRSSFFGESFYEALSMDPAAVRMGRLQSGAAPLLDAHNAYSNSAVLGVIERAKLGAGKGSADVRFMKGGDANTEDIWKKIVQRIIRNVSVGYATYRMEDAEMAADGVPVRIATDWEPMEISMVPVPADAGAGVRAHPQVSRCTIKTRAQAPEGKTMAAAPPKDRAESDDDNADKTKDESEDDKKLRVQRERDDEDEKRARKRADEDEAVRRQREDEDMGRSEGDKDEDGDSDRAAANLTTRDAQEYGGQLERARMARITSAVTAAHIPASDKPVMIQRMIEDNTPIGEVKNVVMAAELAAYKAQRGVDEKGRPVSYQSPITAVEDSVDKFVRGTTAWIIQRTGMGAKLKEAARMAKDGKLDHLNLDSRTMAFLQDANDEPGEFRGYSLIRIAEEALARRGVKNARGMQLEDLVKRSFERSFAYYERDISVGGNTTSDFTFILENVLHKTLLAFYAITPDTWREWMTVGSAVDFRPQPRYRLGSFSGLTDLSERGEFENQTIPDAEKQTISVGTKGMIIGLSRQSMVNDDMGAFAALAGQLGRAAKLTAEKLAYTTLGLNAGLGPLLFDGFALFDSLHHSNVGTGAALSVASVDADRVLMKSQKDFSNNEFLDLVPSVLLVPVALGGIARVINSAVYDQDATDFGQSNKFMVPNRVAGLYGKIVDTARLSGTRRYTFADPGVAPVMEMIFLQGQQQPFVDFQQGFRSDGMEWKIRLDLACGGIDFRGGVVNAGA